MTRLPRPNPAFIKPRLYTSREVRDRFGVSHKTLQRWRREGILTPIKPDGYHNLYDAAEVDALRAAGTSPRRSP